MKRDLRSKIIAKRIKENVKLVETGQLKPGNIVYCSKELDDVLILKNPDPDNFEEYYKSKKAGDKYPPFSGDITYKTQRSEIKKAPLICFTPIQNGNHTSDFSISKNNTENRVRAKRIEFTARMMGFRVEKEQLPHVINFRFFGDSKRDIDDFIIHFCINSQELF